MFLTVFKLKFYKKRYNIVHDPQQIQIVFLFRRFFDKIEI